MQIDCNKVKNNLQFEYTMNERLSQPNLTSQDFMMSQLDSDDMPAGIMYLPHIAKLENLIIKNFKSFKEQTFTGPFLGFTSIIGPNGSGKSNILDALMFCLCGENLKHNFFDLREYINREKTESYKEMSKKKKVCSITANFVLETGQHIALKRQLDPDSNETFYIDKQEVSKKVYENFLFRQGINPHIPNYAITQGQIDKLLLKQPLELTRYIENLSGSFLFKKQYDSTREEVKQIRKNLVLMGQKIVKLKNDKKTAKNLNQASRQCQELEKQYEQTVNRLFLAKVFMRDIDLEEYEDLIVKKRNEQKERTQQINRRKLKIQEELREKQDINKEINGIQRKILELNSKLKTLNRPDLIIKTKQLQSHQKELAYMQSELINLDQKRKKLQQNMPQIHSTQTIQEYLKIFSHWQSKNREINFELQNKKTLYFNLQSQRQFQRSLLQSEEEKQKQYKGQEQKRRRDIESAKEQISQINQVIQKLQKDVKDKQQMFAKNQAHLREQRQEFQKIQNQVQNLEELLTEDVQNAKDKQVIKRLSIVDGFKGIIQQKIRPTNQRYIVAFSILTAGISKYLLCKDEKSSKSISEKLKDMNTIKTLIILSNVKKASSDNTSFKQNVGKSGISSIDIIDFDKNLEGMDYFLQQFCRGKVICDDLKTAFEIRNKKVPGLREIITLDGEIIKNDGTIASCGNTEHVKRTYKLGSNKKSLEAQFQKSVKTRDQLRQKIQKLQKQCKPEEQIKRNEQIIKIQKKKQQIQLRIQYLSSLKPKQTKSFKIIERDISILTQKIDKVQKQISSIQKSMSKDQQMTQFMKKHNIQNLDSFRMASNLQVLQKQAKRKNQILRQVDQIVDKIETLKSKIEHKALKAKNLKEQLNLGGENTDQKSVQSQIFKNQQKIKLLRQKVSKLGLFRQVDIQLRSQVIQMETKFKFLKQKNRQFIEDLKVQLGVTISTPRSKADFKRLEDYIAAGSMDEISKKKIEKAIKDLEAEKKISEDKLQKFNSMNLMSKNHSNDEAEIVAQIKSLTDAVQDNTKRRNQLQQKLQKLKSQRKSIFLTFFEKVKGNLKQCYELLTQLQPGVAGKADLFLQNSELPFENGIYFTPTPPTKRFIYDLEQLSGGQKSIASLALQYALAISSRSPFLILDESDAYLDSNNASKLLRLLDESFKAKRLQIILITHKFTIFGNCQSLVGVTRPKQQFSKIFSCKVK